MDILVDVVVAKKKKPNVGDSVTWETLEGNERTGKVVSEYPEGGVYCVEQSRFHVVHLYKITKIRPHK